MDLSDLKEIIVLLALIALIGAATSIALDDFNDGLSKTTGTVTAESATITVHTAQGLARDEVTAILFVSNATGIHLNGGEYTLINSGSPSSQINITNASKSGTSWNINYTFYENTIAHNITENGLAGVDSSTQYLDTTGTIAGVAVLISIVILAFGVMMLR